MISVAEHLGSAVEITAPHEAESCNVTLESAGGGQSVHSAQGSMDWHLLALVMLLGVAAGKSSHTVNIRNVGKFLV